MSVVRRALAGAAVVGVVLAGGPAWAAMEQPAYAPEIAEGGLAPGDDPCLGSQPVEPGDGVVTDGDTPVSSDGSTGAPAQTDPPVDGGGSEPSDPGTEPAPGGEVEPVEEPTVKPVEEPAPGEAPRPGEAPGTPDGEVPPDGDGVVCAYAEPISAPVLEGGAVQDSAGSTGAGPTTARQDSATQSALPRTGTGRTTVLLALGAGLLVGGAGATALARRRPRTT